MTGNIIRETPRGGESLAASRRPQTQVFALCWLSILTIVALWRMSHRMDHAVIPDALHRYFPYARRFIDEGWGFLLSPDSFHVAPLGYLWPALFNNNLLTIRWVNASLFVICLILLWRICQQLGGTRAAVVATGLMVAHPQLYTLFPVELTEPLFFTGALLWVYGLVGIAEQSGRRWRYISMAAFGLAITLLSRPVLQVTSLFLLLLTAAIGLWPSKVERRESLMPVQQASRAAALSIALAFVPAAAIAIKNGLLFGVWGITTGSGAALLLGVHPLSLGAEPAYVGLGYDVSSLSLMVPGTDGDHLHPAADRKLALVAMDFIRSMTPTEAAAFFARKLWWWMFHHPEHGSTLRAWRVFAWLALFVSAVISVSTWSQQRATTSVMRPLSARNGVLVLLSIVLASLLAQLQLVLYNSRYSTGALEPWLLILTGVGLASIISPWRMFANSNDRFVTVGIRLQAPRRLPRLATVAAALLLIAGPFVAVRWMKDHEVVTLNAHRLGPTEPVFVSNDQVGIISNGMTQISQSRWRMDASPAALIVPAAGPFTAPVFVNGIWLFQLSIHADKPRRCKRVEVAYTHPITDVAVITPTLAVNADGAMHTYAVHANGNMRPARAGALRVAFHCPAGTVIDWGGMELRRSSTDALMARHLALPARSPRSQPMP